jgi:ribulose-phosphate 3-epimerase
MNTIKLSSSILSADFAELADQIKQVENAGVDWLHIDVIDGHFAPNLTMGPFIVNTCKRVSKLPLDVHLMINNPENLIDAFVEAGASTLSIHVENNPNVVRTLQYIKSHKVRAGIVLSPGTPASALESILPYVDQVLIMTVNPGFSGQSFMPEMAHKIKIIHQMIQNTTNSIGLEVDGGINEETLPIVLNAGADIIVAATAIFGHPQGIQAGVRTLRNIISLNKNRDNNVAISE